LRTEKRVGLVFSQCHKNFAVVGRFVDEQEAVVGEMRDKAFEAKAPTDGDRLSQPGC